VVARAVHSRKDASQELLALLEARLDNVVFRAGLARTIPAARQLVVHGHVTVVGRRVDIPSFRVRAGHRIGLTDRGQRNQTIANAVLQPRFPAPRWLTVDATSREAVVSSAPDASSVLVPVDVRLIVEYYSLRL
jgi:small subunit ribosomal protein S4